MSHSERSNDSPQPMFLCSRCASEGKIRGAILSLLTEQSAPVAEREILKSVRGRKQNKMAALRALVRDGTVRRLGGGLNKDPYVYFAAERDRSRVREE